MPCDAPNDCTFRVCRNCGDNLIKWEFTINSSSNIPDPYSHFNIKENPNKIKVTVGEPELINPSEFKNISKVLRNLGRKLGIQKYNENSNRQWLFSENDDGIYHIVMKLIHNVLQCPKCNVSIYGKETFSEHNCAKLRDVLPKNEFDWIVLSPGLLHFEMNAGRAFIKLNWSVFMESVAKELGFTSENSLNYIRKGSDHILEYTYIALADELLVPYVRYCLLNSIDPDISGYWKYCDSIKNRKYFYTQEMTFTYLHALMLLQKGIHMNSSKAVYAARNQLSLMFFGRNHPIYHNIIFHEFHQQVRQPNKFRVIAESSISITQVGNIGHYQSGDTLLEEINKSGKKMAYGSTNKFPMAKKFPKP